MKTAKLLMERVSPSGAVQKTYELSEPFDGHSIVVVSAVNAMFSGDETYIFPGNADGTIADYLEMSGSFRGEQNHEKALRNAGYEVSL